MHDLYMPPHLIPYEYGLECSKVITVSISALNYILMNIGSYSTYTYTSV